MAIIVAFVSLGIIVLVSDRLGFLFLKKSEFKNLSSLRLGLGFAALSYLIFVLGIFKVLDARLVISISLIFIFLMLRFKRGSLFTARNFSWKDFYRGYLKSLTLSDKCLALLLGLYFLLLIINALTPAMARDELTYHLFLPKIWLANKAVFSLPENIYSFFPHFWEMLYVYSLAIGNEITAKLLHLFTLFLCLKVIIDILRLVAPQIAKRSLLLASLVFVSTPTINRVAVWAYVDIAQTYYILTALFLLLYYVLNGKKPAFYLSAIFLGFALAIKYLSLVWLILFIFIIAEKFLQKGNFKKCLKSITVYCLLAIACGLPYYIKNYLTAANPVYPFFYNIFGGKFIDLGKSELLNAYFSSFGYGKTIGDLLLMPWRIFFQAGFDSHQAFDGVIGLAYLGLIIFLIINRRRLNFPFKSFIYMPLLGVLFWFLLSRQIRFLIPVLAILIILSFLLSHQLKAKWLGIFILIVAVFNLYYPLSIFCQEKPYLFILGKENKSEFLRRNISAVYPLIELANNSIPNDSKIMLLLSGQVAYLFNRGVYQESVFEEEIFLKKLKAGQNELIGFLKVNNITHLFVNGTALSDCLVNYRLQSLRYDYLQFIKQQTIFIAVYNGYYLYKIKPN